MKKPNTSDIQDAIIKWRGYDSRSSLAGRDFHEFAGFIGHPHNPHIQGGLIVNTDDPDVCRVIDLINGPNGTAILKMLQIRNQERENGAD